MTRLPSSIKLSLFGALLLALTSAPALLARDGDDAPKAQRVLVHLSHSTNDLHAAFMAIKLADLMRSRGAEVTLFLDLEGARLADRRQPLDVTWGHSRVLAQHYESFRERGGAVVVCPHCAKAAGLKAENLRPGVSIGNEEKIAELLLKADKILDY